MSQPTSTAARLGLNLYPAPLRWSAAVVRYGRYILDRGDCKSGRLKRTERRFTTRSRSPYPYFQLFDAVLHRLAAGILGGQLRRIRGRFPRPLESLLPRRGPSDGIALGIGDRDLRVVERGVHMRDRGRDVLAFATPDSRRPLYHDVAFTRSLPGRVREVRFIFSCPQWRAPVPCGCEHWCASADHEPAARDGDAVHDSSPGPSAA